MAKSKALHETLFRIALTLGIALWSAWPSLGRAQSNDNQSEDRETADSSEQAPAVHGGADEELPGDAERSVPLPPALDEAAVAPADDVPDPATLPLPGMSAAAQDAQPESAAQLPPEPSDREAPVEAGVALPLPAANQEAGTEEPSFGELFGHFGFELRLFPLSPTYPSQPRYHNTSLVFEPGYALELGEHTMLRGIGFLRLDEHDSERSHFDVREALLQARTGAFTATLGINKVFWGVTESRHLVDIINQTDFQEDFSGDEKYGQLMAVAAYATDTVGSFDFIVATWFRPQRYPSVNGRPAVPLPLLDEGFESKWAEYQPDLALRWSHSIGAFDWALSYFYGTSREPELLPVVILELVPPFIPVLQLALEPRYALIQQGGLEFQWTEGGWLWKLEAMLRQGQGPTFAATTAGFEYTLYAPFGGTTDLGVLVEYNYDGRDNATLNIYDHDVFGGVRVSPNDEAGSELLLAALTDTQSGVTSGLLEASRGFGQHWRLLLDGRIFYAEDDSDPLYWFRRDHYGQVTVEYHF